LVSGACEPVAFVEPGAPAGERHRFTVVYDEHCALCRRAREWLTLQPTYVDLELLAAGSAEAHDRYGALPWLGEELVVVDGAGHVWVGPAAFLVALWSTRQYRHWAYRLSGPAFAPMAERFFHLVSSKRRRLGAMLGSPECTYCARPGVRS
jgi:predicted DCC family thiol-disulfide oxidoreductase YuxK